MIQRQPVRPARKRMPPARPRLAMVAGLLACLAAFSACGPSRNNAQTANAELQAGLAAHYAGRISEAEQHYKNVLTHDANNKWALYNLGVIAQSKGNDSEADKDYTKVLQVDPNFASAAYNDAIIKDKSSPQAAVDLYNRVIAIQPGWASAHLNLGLALVQVGKTADAQAQFSRAIALDPTMRSRVPAQYVGPAPSPSPSK